jgi:cytochrome c oxidase assembly protein subunit 15
MARGARAEAAPGPVPGLWRSRFARVVAGSTLLLIFAGGLVTSTGSGLAVPDWPLSYGRLFPGEFTEGFRRIGITRGVVYEHGHRMIAGAVGLLTLALAIWVGVAEPRRWVRWLAAAAAGAVAVQAILGGVTVLLHLPAGVSVAHAALANAFLLMVVALAVASGRRWAEAAPAAGAAGLRNRAAAALAVIYLQVLLGAVMRHTGAGLAIHDFPRSLGRWIPPLDDPGVAIHFAHRVGALVVAVVVAATVARALRRHRGERDLLAPALLLGALVAAQATLGAFVVWTAKSVPVTTLHVALGSATLAAALVLALRAGRRAARGARERPEPVRGASLFAKEGRDSIPDAGTARSAVPAARIGSRPAS